MADQLDSVKLELLNEVVAQSQSVLRFRVKHETKRKEIDALVTCWLIRVQSDAYHPTLAGVMMSTSTRRKPTIDDVRDVHQAMVSHFMRTPERPVTTSLLASVLQMPKPRVNYIVKLFSDGSVPNIAGSGSYAEGGNESSFNLSENILDYKSFDQFLEASVDLVKQRGGHLEPSVPSRVVIPAQTAKEASGKWRWKGKIAEGGQAETFLLNDVHGHKFIGKRLKNPKRLERFKKEISALSRVDHHRIVKIVDSELDTEKPYIVMEYCEGSDLDRNRFWRGSLGAKFAVIRQVLEGLRVAHAEGIIHRDIKPANILLRHHHGDVAVADFGICYLRDEEAPRETATMDVMGPRWFLAPEYEAGFVDEPKPWRRPESCGNCRSLWLES